MKPNTLIDLNSIDVFHPAAWDMMGFPEPPPPPEGEEVFIRFSAPPVGGRSFNVRDKHYEPGTATFRAYKLSEREYILDYQRQLLPRLLYPGRWRSPNVSPLIL